MPALTVKYGIIALVCVRLAFRAENLAKFADDIGKPIAFCAVFFAAVHGTMAIIVAVGAGRDAADAEVVKFRDRDHSRPTATVYSGDDDAAGSYGPQHNSKRVGTQAGVLRVWLARPKEC